jgi:hypothetical protein
VRDVLDAFETEYERLTDGEFGTIQQYDAVRKVRAALRRLDAKKWATHTRKGAKHD